MEANVTRNNPVTDPVTASGDSNSVPFISQLPTELLTEIFLLSLPEIDLKSGSGFSSRSYVKRLYRMRSVTKRWQEIIEGTPSFWTTIASTLPPHVNEASIVRSSDLPLSVIYHRPLYANPLNYPSEAEFLKLIQHSRPRWSAAALDFYDPKAMAKYLGAPLPLMQTIIVRSARLGSLESEPLELLQGDTINLRVVYLSGVSISCSVGCFVQLKCLTLKNVAHNGLTGPRLLDTLRASPGLEVLNLKGIRTEVPPPSPTITLHHLRCIKLRSCAIDLIAYILRQIQAPSCTRLCLGIDDEEQFDVPNFLNETLKSFRRTLFTIHQRLGGSTLLLDSGGFGWYTHSDAKMEGFSIFIHGFFLPSCVCWVDGILQDESGLQISFGRGGTSSEAVLRSVAPMRSVTKVLIRESWRSADVRAALKFIGESLPTSTSLPSLPYLQELLLPSGGWTAGDLLEMVQSRFSASSWNDMERTLLTINLPRGGFSWTGTTSPILNLSTLLDIRGTSGIRCVKLAGWKDHVVTQDTIGLEPQWLKVQQVYSLAPVDWEHLMEITITRNDAAADQTTAPWRNNHSPSISQLPTELLAEIFQLSIPEIDFKSRSVSSSSREYVKRLYIMRSVLKRWQAIIEGTPSFWTTIAFELPSHVNEASIHRSANLPLSIVCYNPVVKHSGGRRSEMEFIELIQPVRPRWSTLILDLYDQTALSDYLGAPSPLLHTIVVKTVRRPSLDFEPLELLGGDTSNLRWVELSRVSIHWRMGCFLQLKCLKLKGVTQNSLTTQQLLDAICASPGLQVLKLTGITVPDIPQPSPIITFHQLQYIKLYGCDIRLVDFILRAIQAPSCTTLDLGIVDDDRQFDAPRFLDDTLKSFHPILREIHRLHGESEVVLDSRGIEWHTEGDSDVQCFSIEIDHFFDPLFTDWVDRILEDETGLTISFGYGGTSSEAVLRSVASMRRVTKVSMTETWRGIKVSQALWFLGQALATSPSLPSFPCLQELRLPPEGWNTRDLLEMVQSRFCTLGWEAMVQTPLTIYVQRGGWRRIGDSELVLDFATIVNIRNTSGVECLNLAGCKDPEGMLAVRWDEEASKVVWV